MPIRRDLRHHYGLTWKHVTRPLILRRAGGQVTGPDENGRYVYHGGAHCERCNKRDGATVETISIKDPDAGRLYMLWREAGSTWHWQDGHPAQTPIGAIFENQPRWLRNSKMSTTVLTVAHLNHIPGDDRDENLEALCGWCHLHLDGPHHRESRRGRKDTARPLLPKLPNAS